MIKEYILSLTQKFKSETLKISIKNQRRTVNPRDSNTNNLYNYTTLHLLVSCVGFWLFGRQVEKKGTQKPLKRKPREFQLHHHLHQWRKSSEKQSSLFSRTTNPSPPNQSSFSFLSLLQSSSFNPCSNLHHSFFHFSA